ncbi:MAG: hypothetical protein AB1602_05740 [Elusimicrobiota bacterium]
MNCDKQKIAAAYYGESSLKEKEETLNHIKDCEECRKFYDTLNFIEKNLKTVDYIKTKVRNNILIYAGNNLTSAKNYLSKIFYAFSLSLAVLVLFVMPGKNSIVQRDIEFSISKAEYSLSELYYDIKFTDADFNY